MLSNQLCTCRTSWNNVQQAQESNETRIFNSDSAPSPSQMHTSNLPTNSKPGVVNLMDEIADDAFCLDKYWDGQSDFCDSQLHISLDDNLGVGDPAVPVIGLESNQTSLLRKSFPEFIESYFLSEFHPVSELSLNNQSLNEIPKCRSKNVGNGDVGRENNRWYGDASLRIVENHVSEVNEQTGQKLLVEECPTFWNYLRKGYNCYLFQFRIFILMTTAMMHLWKLVLGYYQSRGHPRESSSKAFKLELEAVRPDPLTPLEEYRLRIAFLPMLLHLHQGQLDFFISFFGGSSVDQSPSAPQDSGESKMLPKKSSNFGGHTISEEALLPYFQKFDIWPVLVRIDYSPRHVDLAALRGGKYVELVNLVPWKGVELQLKHNQIHKLLQGLPPIRSLVAVGSGAGKLVSLPVKNYRKDHRLLKGVQRGTIAFLRSISLEAVGLGVHLAAGAHDILLQAEYILTSIPPSVPWPVQSRMRSNIRSNQPKDARQGMQQACESISDGLGKCASALVQTPLKRYQSGGGAGSALATAVQAAPVAAVAPAAAAACAVHCALLGIRNSLDPEHKKESMEKYLGPTQPREDKRKKKAFEAFLVATVETLYHVYRKHEADSFLSEDMQDSNPVQIVNMKSDADKMLPTKAEPCKNSHLICVIRELYSVVTRLLSFSLRP
ncbi:hypothetical protein F0562_028668 [Nyssa sinensis]|uniref:Autophagy-related protein 2 n=1 Tax=Nyssa sinensis TaxID=561372 RepID=A0A5J5B0X9_9ASTE|nr:hypothetical protein F0562_028668 [Nyssa sinensis]